MIFLDISEWCVDALIISLCIFACTVSLAIIMMIISLSIGYVERKWYGKY